jgi:hypothetical protein
MIRLSLRIRSMSIKAVLWLDLVSDYLLVL